jgi:hypothetical protein
MPGIKFAGNPIRAVASITAGTFITFVTPSKTRNNTTRAVMIRAAHGRVFEI